MVEVMLKFLFCLWEGLKLSRILPKGIRVVTMQYPLQYCSKDVVVVNRQVQGWYLDVLSTTTCNVLQPRCHILQAETKGGHAVGTLYKQIEKYHWGDSGSISFEILSWI